MRLRMKNKTENEDNAYAINNNCSSSFCLDQF